MSAITRHYCNVQQLLQSQSFSIDENQREYTREKENIDELLSDLKAKFFRHYKPRDETTPTVSGYGELVAALVEMVWSPRRFQEAAA